MWWIWLRRLAYGAGGLAGVGLGLLYALQEKMLYVPVIPGGERGYEFTPNQFQINHEDMYLHAEDGTKLHAWLLWDKHWTKESLKTRQTILFFQANAGNISHRLHYFKEMIGKLGCVVVALSYRGYGWSEGSPTEAGLKLDSEAILRELEASPTVNSKDLIVFGRSLGGAVAIHLTAQHPDKVKALVIENAFTSVEEMVPQVLPLLGYLIGRGKIGNFLVRNKWHNRKEIRKLKNMPILFFSSEMDEMVPQEQMLELRKMCGSSDCEFVSMRAHHMDAYFECPQQYWSAFQELVGKCD
ncbi:hypothetical protein BSKO_12396 [Bryopsis sp. KO-2023]|nr:hypothetical protein BSKO_12396 [Bryopsis sp. KO-2023]